MQGWRARFAMDETANEKKQQEGPSATDVQAAAAAPAVPPEDDPAKLKAEISALRSKGKVLEDELEVARARVRRLDKDVIKLKAHNSVLADSTKLLGDIMDWMDDLWKRLGPMSAQYYQHNLQGKVTELRNALALHKSELEAALRYTDRCLVVAAPLFLRCSAFEPDGSRCSENAAVGSADGGLCFRHVREYLRKIAKSLKIKPDVPRVMEVLLRLVQNANAQKSWKKMSAGKRV